MLGGSTKGSWNGSLLIEMQRAYCFRKGTSSVSLEDTVTLGAAGATGATPHPPSSTLQFLLPAVTQDPKIQNGNFQK